MNATHFGFFGLAVAVVVGSAAIAGPLLRGVYREQASTSATTTDGGTAPSSSVPIPEPSADSAAIAALTQQIEMLVKRFDDQTAGTVHRSNSQDPVSGGAGQVDPAPKIGVQFDPTSGELAYYSAAGIPLWSKLVPGNTNFEQRGNIIILSPSGDQYDVESGEKMTVYTGPGTSRWPAPVQPVPRVRIPPTCPAPGVGGQSCTTH